MARSSSPCAARAPTREPRRRATPPRAHAPRQVCVRVASRCASFWRCPGRAARGAVYNKDAVATVSGSVYLSVVEIGSEDSTEIRSRGVYTRRACVAPGRRGTVQSDVCTRRNVSFKSTLYRTPQHRHIAWPLNTNRMLLICLSVFYRTPCQRNQHAQPPPALARGAPHSYTRCPQGWWHATGTAWRLARVRRIRGSWRRRWSRRCPWCSPWACAPSTAGCSRPPCAS